MKKIIFILFCLLVFGEIKAQHKLIEKWTTDTLLKVPESVILYPKNNVLYTSNIDVDGTNPWVRDGKGSIGKIGLDGKIIAAEWIKGLNAPKGLGHYENNLYVADLNEVVVIDIAKAAILKKIPVADAERLNDITIDKKGVVYVSDSKTKKVHRIEKDQVTLFLENLKSPNGLLIHKDNLYVLDNGALLRVENDKKLTKIADGMEGGTDGVENVQGNDFLVSCWSGTVWYVKEDGTKELLLDTGAQKINAADICYDSKSKILYVPTFWKNSVTAYQLK